MAGSLPTTPEAAQAAFSRIAGPTAQRRSVRIDEAEASRGLLGAELQSRLDEALALRASGPSERPGAAVAARLTPTQGREDALVASFRALPGGDQAAVGFERLMEVLQAQTFAPARNSATAARTEASQRATGGVRAAMNPMRETQRAIEDWSRNVNTSKLAKALTTPQGVNMLRALAGIDSAARREAVVRQILNYDRARRAAEERAPTP
jgi:hypothetical protein